MNILHASTIKLTYLIVDVLYLLADLLYSLDVTDHLIINGIKPAAVASESIAATVVAASVTLESTVAGLVASCQAISCSCKNSSMHSVSSQSESVDNSRISQLLPEVSVTVTLEILESRLEFELKVPEKLEFVVMEVLKEGEDREVLCLLSSYSFRDLTTLQ